MSSKLFKRIRFKLIIIFVVAVVAVVGVVLGLNWRIGEFIHENSRIGSLINDSGRQRMLSQQMTKEVLLLQSGNDVSHKVRYLDSLLGVFERTHHHLLSENDLLDVPDSSKRSLDSLLEILDPYIAGMLSASRGIVATDSAIQRAIFVEKLLENEANFLPAMDGLVVQYVRLSHNVLEDIDTNVSLMDYIIALAVIISASSVFFITISSIKAYSDRLEFTQEQLRASVREVKGKVEKLEFLTSAIRVGIWEKGAGKNEEKWSEQLYHLLGLSNQEVSGTLMQFIDHVHPADRPVLLEASEVSYKTGRSSNVEVRVKTKPGVYKWVEVSGNVKRDQDGKVNLMIGGVIDIHDRKVLENQLLAFVENAPAAIAMFDNELDYVAVSKEWVEAYGFSDQQLIGVNLYETFPDLGENWKAIHRKCLAGAIEKREEDRFELENGGVLWLKWEIRPWYVSEDEIGGILVLTENITEVKRRSDELREAKEQAEKASKAKEEFLATMTHEIRTPLNAIIGMTHILSSEDPKPDQVSNLDLLRFSADNLLTLINDILDISKIESGKLKLDEKPFDLYYLVENVSRSLNYRAKENMVHFTTSYDSELPRILVGDVTRITQILFNLAGNAIKFSKEGEVNLSVSLLAKDGEDYTFRVSVQDTGIGISEEHQKKIFLSFEQADTGTTRQFGGTGLGLFITKRLLQMMDSDIQLNSELGQGSDFFFEIKLKKGTIGVSRIHSYKSDRPDFSNRNIVVLIAEDNITNRIIVGKFLNNTGIQYDFAEDGQEVLERLETKAYDLILMDLQMPVMDGVAATIRIRSSSDPYMKKIPIVALTSDAFSDIKDKTLSIGMDDYLSKPFRPRDLFQVLDKYSGRVEKSPA